MKKVILLFVFFVSTLSFAQPGSSIIFDSTQFGIRSFHTFKIAGINNKLVYVQQGLTQTGPGYMGGTVYVLQDDRLNWSEVPFLNAQYCAIQNRSYPVNYIVVSRTVPSIAIFNGIFECSSPQTSGDYSKITYTAGTTTVDLPFHGVDSIQQCRGFDISKTNPNIMYMAHTYYEGVFHNEPRIFKSTNGGHNWFVTDTLQGMKPINHNIIPEAGFLKILDWNNNYVFTSTDEHPAYSLDGGYNFQVRTDLPPFKMIVFDEGDWWLHGIAYDNRIYCNNGNITNQWVPASNPFNILCIEIDPEDHTKWYAGSETNGVWKSTNAGVTFHPYNNSFTPSKKVIGISKDAGSGDTIIVATDKRVYKVWQPLLVNTESNETALPESFSLSQNYPNPFNPVTHLEFGISNLEFVSLKVYDALGNEIQTLVNENKPAGRYEIEFDGRDLPSGIYFYKLEADDFSETKRMILIK